MPVDAHSEIPVYKSIEIWDGSHPAAADGDDRGEPGDRRSEAAGRRAARLRTRSAALLTAAARRVMGHLPGLRIPGVLRIPGGVPDLPGLGDPGGLPDVMDLAVGAVAALVVAGGCWLAAAAFTLAVWATAAPNGDSVAAPLHVAGQLWLAANHVRLQTPDGPFGLSPLGFTALPLGSLVLAGRYAARRFAAGVWSLAAVAAGYPLLALCIAWAAASGSLRADLGAAVGYPLLFACCGYGAGLLSARTPTLGRRTITAVRAGFSALAVLLGGAAMIAALALCMRFTDAVHLGDSVGRGAAGDAGLFLVDLALVPNLVVWTLSFAAGPGFAVGRGSSVSVGGSVHGALPGLPLLQGVPRPGALSPWAVLALMVPLLAGMVAVRIAGRSDCGLTERAAVLGAAVPAVGAVAWAGAALSGGPVAAGAMSVLGPVPWEVALAVVGELAFVALFGFGLWYVIDRRRGYTGRLRPENRPTPALKPLPLPPGASGAESTEAPGDGLAHAVGSEIECEQDGEGVSWSAPDDGFEAEEAQDAPLAPGDDNTSSEELQDPDGPRDQGADDDRNPALGAAVADEPVAQTVENTQREAIDGHEEVPGVGGDRSETVSGHSDGSGDGRGDGSVDGGGDGKDGPGGL
jgi:hypothetical protein